MFSYFILRYYYDSPAQVALAVLFAILGVLFFIFCFKSWSVEENKRKVRLYQVMACVYSFWFICPAIGSGIASALDPWVRDIAMRCNKNALTSFFSFDISKVFRSPPLRKVLVLYTHFRKLSFRLICNSSQVWLYMYHMQSVQSWLVAKKKR